jgi:predicted glycogen debranching enzyme
MPERDRPPALRVSPEIRADLTRSLRLEWLETNGLGGYASATVTGAHTRRYHGLLIASTQPPTGRTVLFHRVDETVSTSRGSFELATNLFHPDIVHPEGYRALHDFALDPFPTWVFEVPGARVTKTVFMPHGRNAVVVRYRLSRSGDAPVSLAVRLFVNCRDHHQETRANDFFRREVEQAGGGRLLRMSPYDGAAALWLAHDGTFSPDGHWYHSYRHPEESARGLNDREDAYTPGSVVLEAADEAVLSIVAWTQPGGFDEVADAGALASELEVEERARREVPSARSPRAPDSIQHLTRTADQFLVWRATDADPRIDGACPATVIAGYPWFTDWGRDTLISLPGLTLPTGRFDVARRVLRTFVEHVDQGMVPNFFPDAGQTPEYNTIDASLWLFHAVGRYLAYTGDWDFARSVHETLVDMVRWHVGGTRYGIRIDDDGLLGWDAPGVQPTWMDARVGDWVVTPRRGKPVEVNALWFNALHVLQRIARKIGDQATAREAAELAKRCEHGFAAFWNPERGTFHDVLTPTGPDASVRPNQIFAASLPFPLVTGARARAMLTVVERELLTPLGLRSLSPNDPAYRGHYGGGPAERDAVYHQGTVWAWLIGPFLSAFVASAGSKARARKRAGEILAPLLAHVAEAGLGSASEIFDGDAPHAANGCPWQAWSVAEILRVWSEDVNGRCPSL